MKDIISFWPLLVVIVVFFFIARLWVSLVDGAASGVKKILGIKPKKITWHTLENEEGDGEKKK